MSASLTAIGVDFRLVSAKFGSGDRALLELLEQLLVKHRDDFVTMEEDRLSIL